MISSDKKNNDSKSVVLTRHSTRKDVAETGVIRMFVGAPDGAVKIQNRIHKKNRIGSENILFVNVNDLFQINLKPYFILRSSLGLLRICRAILHISVKTNRFLKTISFL